jgi:hypothetical protein
VQEIDPYVISQPNLDISTIIDPPCNVQGNLCNRFFVGIYNISRRGSVFVPQVVLAVAIHIHLFLWILFARRYFKHQMREWIWTNECEDI